MRKRTQSREFALQILYQVDMTNDAYDATLKTFWQAHQDKPVDDEVKVFTAELVKGVTEQLKLLDSKISQYATNWELQRMAVVERNILRLSAYELLFRNDIPPKVAINEGVELAKRYAGLNAGRFVNGILDKIKSEQGPSAQ